MTGARPLVVGVAELHRQPGTQRPVTVAAHLAGLEVSESAVPDDGPVTAELVLESLADGTVIAQGTVSAPWTGQCRRCLAPVAGQLMAEVRELFEARPTEGETYRLVGDEIDLEPLVRDAVMLALPLGPLCRPGCPGPDPDSFPVASGGVLTAEGEPRRPEDSGPPPRDPRWAALDVLRGTDADGEPESGR